MNSKSNPHSHSRYFSLPVVDQIPSYHSLLRNQNPAISLKKIKKRQQERELDGEKPYPYCFFYPIIHSLLQ